MELDFTIHQKENIIMLYDRSGFRLSTPARYQHELLNRRQPEAGYMWTFQQMSTLVLHR